MVYYSGVYYYQSPLYYEQWDQGNKVIRDRARRGADRALAFTEFADSENRTEEEIDNLLLFISLNRFKIPTDPQY